LQDGHMAASPALITQTGSEAAHRVQWINIGQRVAMARVPQMRS
jgi:hypothetical protein